MRSSQRSNKSRIMPGSLLMKDTRSRRSHGLSLAPSAQYSDRAAQAAAHDRTPVRRAALAAPFTADRALPREPPVPRPIARCSSGWRARLGAAAPPGPAMSRTHSETELVETVSLPAISPIVVPLPAESSSRSLSGRPLREAVGSSRAVRCQQPIAAPGCGPSGRERPRSARRCSPARRRSRARSLMLASPAAAPSAMRHSTRDPGHNLPDGYGGVGYGAKGPTPTDKAP